MGNVGIGIIFGIRAFDALAAMVTVEVRVFPIRIDGNNPELVMAIWVTDFVVNALNFHVRALRTKRAYKRVRRALKMEICRKPLDAYA